jgi:uncharacterized protein (TIGR02611 family)
VAATNITLDATDDDWRWRRRIRWNRHSHLIYRVVVGVIGRSVVVSGLIMVPFPGPGWLVVLSVWGLWASEFERAQRLLRPATGTLKAWTGWLIPRPWWVKGLVLLVTVAAVTAVFWLLFLISAVLGYFPDIVEQRLKKVHGWGAEIWARRSVDQCQLGSTRLAVEHANRLFFLSATRTQR